MKKLAFAAIAAAASLTLLAGAQNDMRLLFETQGIDTYKGGTQRVLDGEFYALVWTPAGAAFAGFNADGTLTGAADELVAAVPFAKGGRLPLTVKQIPAARVSHYAQGTFTVVSLDTRKADHSVGYRKTYGVTGEGHGVYALWVRVIVWPWVEGQGLACRLALRRGQLSEQSFGIVHVKWLRRLCGIACAGVGVGVGVGDVGLDVEYRRAVDEVGAAYVYHGSQDGVVCDAHQLNRRQAYVVGPEGAAGGEDPQAAVAAEAWRPHRGTPVLPLGKMEEPHYPQVFKVVEAAQCLGHAVAGLEDYAALPFGQPSLPRHAELGRVGRLDVRYGVQRDCHTLSKSALFLTSSVGMSSP